MSTPAEQRRAWLRLPLRIALLLTLASPAAQAIKFRKPALPSVSLAAAGHPTSAIEVVWTEEGQQIGEIDVFLESELNALASGDPAPPLVLQVRPAQPGSRISVRQRSVSYLNLSRDGPHIAVPGTERRSGWTELTATPVGDFRVHETAEQAVRLDRKHLAAVLGDQPEWLKVAQACPSPDEGACYTVTDPEFEITVTTADGATTRATVRVTNPNGC